MSTMSLIKTHFLRHYRSYTTCSWLANYENRFDLNGVEKEHCQVESLSRNKQSSTLETNILPTTSDMESISRAWYFWDSSVLIMFRSYISRIFVAFTDKRIRMGIRSGAIYHKCTSQTVNVSAVVVSAHAKTRHYRVASICVAIETLVYYMAYV